METRSCCNRLTCFTNSSSCCQVTFVLRSAGTFTAARHTDSVTFSSVAVDRQSHDALLAEVARLEAALEDVRRDVEGLSPCQDGCRHLDSVQQTVREKRHIFIIIKLQVKKLWASPDWLFDSQLYKHTHAAD